MTDATEQPLPYRVVYSGEVREALRRFTARARQAGQGNTFLAALRELDRRLHVYPQFGEPFLDLVQESGQVYSGTVPPLVVRYAVYEGRRLVIVGLPVRLLPNAGF